MKSVDVCSLLKFVEVCAQRDCLPLKLPDVEMIHQCRLMKSGTLTPLCVSG